MEAVSFGIACVMSVCCAPALTGDLHPPADTRPLAPTEAMVDDTRRIVSRYRARFQYPARQAPSKTIVDGPLMGNGDFDVCISAVEDAKRFWLCKNDFWKLTLDHPSGPGGPRVFGGVDVKVPGYGGGWPAEQDLYTAVTTSTYRRARSDARVEMRSWVSATENVLVIELAASGRDAEVEARLWVAEGGGSEVRRGAEGGLQWATRGFKEGVAIPTAAGCAVRTLGRDAAGFTVKAGETVVIVAGVQSLFKSETYLDDVRRVVGEMDAPRLDDLRAKHAAWWRDFWARSFVEIGDPALEQRYYLSHYVMACASRDPEFPPGIFGTWNTSDNPAWMGDYHLNYNHQAPYYALYSSNHIEQAEPYHAPILDFRQRAQWYARNALDCRGAYYPVGIGPKGIETTRNYPTTGYAKPQHVEKGGVFYHQKSNGAYCLVNVAMHWYHTYDTGYAKRLYPLVCDIADFWEDYLKFEDGRYVIHKDSVHERSGNGNDFNSIVSLALVRNALELAIDMSREMGVDADRHEKWRHILEHLSGWSYHELRLPHAPGEDRSVEKPKVKVFRYTERGTPWWRGNTLGIQHIYPAGAIGLDSPPDVLEVARNTIDVRNGWRDGNGMNSFYPAAVRVGYDPEAILAKLREMVRTRGAPNGFHKRNPHGIENCSTVPNTINEMLCMGHGGGAPRLPRLAEGQGRALRRHPGVGRVPRLERAQGRSCQVREDRERARPGVPDGQPVAGRAGRRHA
jgi:hypothetical protein